MNSTDTDKYMHLHRVSFVLWLVIAYLTYLNVEQEEYYLDS